MSEKVFKIKKFPINKYHFSNKFITFVAPTGSGKTVLVLDVLYYLNNIPWGSAYLGGVDGNKYVYKDYIDERFLIPTFDLEDLKKRVAFQREIATYYKSQWDEINQKLKILFEKSEITSKVYLKYSTLIKKIMETGTLKFLSENEQNYVKQIKDRLIQQNELGKYENIFKDQRTFIVFDDCMNEKGFNVKNGSQGSIFSWLTKASRHAYITMMILLQHLKGVGPAVRDNSQLFFYLQPTTMHKNLKELDQANALKIEYNSKQTEYFLNKFFQWCDEPQKYRSVVVHKAFQNTKGHNFSWYVGKIRNIPDLCGSKEKYDLIYEAYKKYKLKDEKKD